MRIIIEEHQYEADKVANILEGICTLRDIDGKISVNYVGYYYNPALKDCVFILPKVLIEDVNGQEMVFGHCMPEEIIDLESQNVLTQAEHDFIYELSVWIYRAITVYHETNSQSNIVLKQNVQQMSKGRLRQCNTFLDIILALQRFNRENQDFFFFVLRNLHSGYNKINWTRTISHSQAIVQGNVPVYLDPVNKKRQINFDEELLVIFFSILNYISQHYGFPVKININFPLITGEMFENYRKGMGKTRLMQIKYKYYSDKALYLWELCYAFFDQSKKINVETDDREYILVKNFNIVFEAIIDELVGDPESEIPEGLKDQPDGKRVDHIYQYQDLTNNEAGKPIYYIGDSKYYKRGNDIPDTSVYKQFTYARNVIQRNLDLFNNGEVQDQQGQVKLRDDITEGYNIIPNFFISARQNTLDSEDTITQTTKEIKEFRSDQFKNRLFDRSTLLIAHYDVNFLFIISLYGRNSSNEKAVWKEKVHIIFREKIQKLLKEKYNFYVMSAKSGTNPDQYMREHFKLILGKVFTPYNDKDYYSLALDSSDEFKEENDTLIALLSQDFNIKPCELGQDPSKILDKEPRVQHIAAPQRFITTHWLEQYLDCDILIGCYKSPEHLSWIQGNNKLSQLIYNVRFDKDRPGSLSRKEILAHKVRFVVVYEYGQEYSNQYFVYRVRDVAEMDQDKMIGLGYPAPSCRKYFCYELEEEVTLGVLDINSLISGKRISEKSEFIEGVPIFVKGSELIKFRK